MERTREKTVADMKTNSVKGGGMGSDKFSMTLSENPKVKL